MKAFAVIGAGYGDEGKGLLTDYLTAKHGGDIVVRYNGGAQAGHTVETPAGERHVFGHLSAGSFVGASTFLSKYFLVNPMAFYKEASKLRHSVRTLPNVYVDPLAFVTTPYDMLINQLAEESRGTARHGSCGLGINETVTRSTQHYEDYKIIYDMLGDPDVVRYRLTKIRDNWFPWRCRELGLDPAKGDHVTKNDNVLENFIADSADMFSDCPSTPPDFLYDAHQVIFEGAQGLMLDEDYGTRPHVTRSYTGLKNILRICRDVGITDLDVTYATRAYVTRHGAGPLSNELPTLPYAIDDQTNLPNNYQGSLRFAYLDLDVLSAAIKHDLDQHKSIFTEVNAGLAVTCLDQVENEVKVYQKGRLQTLRGDAYGDVGDAIGAIVGLDGIPLIKSFGQTRASVVQRETT